MVKKYLGITAKLPPAAEGIIEAPIARKEGSIIERCINESGKYARTDYRVLFTNKNMALAELTLHTGRTHQIRVHAAHPEGLDTPIVGDNLYGRPASRLFLQAESVTFRHFKSGRWVSITAPAPF